MNLRSCRALTWPTLGISALREWSMLLAAKHPGGWHEGKEALRERRDPKTKGHLPGCYTHEACLLFFVSHLSRIFSLPCAIPPVPKQALILISFVVVSFNCSCR